MPAAAVRGERPSRRRRQRSERASCGAVRSAPRSDSTTAASARRAGRRRQIEGVAVRERGEVPDSGGRARWHAAARPCSPPGPRSPPASGRQGCAPSSGGRRGPGRLRGRGWPETGSVTGAMTDRSGSASGVEHLLATGARRRRQRGRSGCSICGNRPRPEVASCSRRRRVGSASSPCRGDHLGRGGIAARTGLPSVSLVAAAGRNRNSM